MNQMNNPLSESEYATAFKSVRVAKNLCMIAIVLAILGQVTGFVLVRFCDVIDATEAPKVEAAPIIATSPPIKITSTKPATAPATKPAPKSPTIIEDNSADRIGSATMWRSILNGVLHTSKVLSPVLGVLLVLTIVLAVQFSLLGRLGGAAGLVSAMLWSMILLVLVCPWQNILHERFACGGMYSLNELIEQTRLAKTSWGASNVPLVVSVFYYARFMGLPLITLLVWFVILVKFRRGYKNMTMPEPTTVEEIVETNDQ